MTGVIGHDGWFTIGGCPCGQAHPCCAADYAVAQQVITGHPCDTVDLTDSAGQTWKVPRTYVACHPVPKISLAALAARYGWSPTPRNPS
jgi:hypothetical protein